MQDVSAWLPVISSYLESHYKPHAAGIMQKLAKATNVTIQQQAGKFVVNQVQEKAQDAVQEKAVEAATGAWFAEIAGLVLALPTLTVQYLAAMYNESQLNPTTKTNPYSPHDDGDRYVAFVVLSWSRQKEPYYQTMVTYANGGYVCSCMSKK